MGDGGWMFAVGRPAIVGALQFSVHPTAQAAGSEAA